MALPLDSGLKVGVQTIHRRTEPAVGVWEPRIDQLVEIVELVDRCGYDSIWMGDHVSFPIPMMDPLLMIAQAAVVSRRLTFGTGVYLLPLRHPAPVAKQVSTLDHLTEGRLIFGVGVGGEFPKEYELCGVPITERGARLSEGIKVLKKLWSGEAVSHSSKFYSFEDVPMQPPARQVGGPSLAGCTQSENSEPGRHHDSLDAGDYAVPNATYAPAMPVVKLAEGFREGEGFLRHDAFK